MYNNSNPTDKRHILWHWLIRRRDVQHLQQPQADNVTFTGNELARRRMATGISNPILTNVTFLQHRCGAADVNY
jgi:hypothetical protein